jgi:hypothetical protein
VTHSWHADLDGTWGPCVDIVPDIIRHCGSCLLLNSVSASSIFLQRRGTDQTLSCFKGVCQNMSQNLESVKNLLVFLGKSLLSVLEALLFHVISKPRKNVAGEIVLITGAGSGLGRLLALQFARLGAVLVLWDVNKEANDETHQLAREAGAARVHAYTCDCSRREEVYRVADQVHRGSLIGFCGL